MSSPQVKLERANSPDEVDPILLEIVKHEPFEEEEFFFSASTSLACQSKRKRKLQDFDEDSKFAEEAVHEIEDEDDEDENDEELDQFHVLHIKCEDEMKLIGIDMDSFNRKNILEKISQAFQFPINRDRIKTNLGAFVPSKLVVATVKQFINSTSFYLEIEKPPEGNKEKPSSNATKRPSWLPAKNVVSKNRVLDIKSLLRETSKGKRVLAYFKKNEHLEVSHREAICQILIDEVIIENIKLCPSDFQVIVDQIVSLFPSEDNVKTFYFVPRDGKKNPSGRLYSKYTNKRKISKRKKQSKKHSNTSTTGNTDCEIDISVATVLRTTLQDESLDWDATEDMWERSFLVRRQDAKKLKPLDFLEAWPKFKHIKAPDLIDMDFRLLYAGKGYSLFKKWDQFKLFMKNYYHENITQKNSKSPSKDMVSLLNENLRKCPEDYITTLLLCHIMQPYGRYCDESGNAKRKFTILDAQESFVLRIPTMKDYEQQIEEVFAKPCHNDTNRRAQPFLIVVGPFDEAVSGFHVYFNKSLYTFTTFISALDTCFKIYHVCNLNYPKPSEAVWNFIQQFLYDIETKNDISLPALLKVKEYLNKKIMESGSCT